MDFHTERKIVFSQESEYKNLYSWSLQEAVAPRSFPQRSCHRRFAAALGDRDIGPTFHSPLLSSLSERTVGSPVGTLCAQSLLLWVFRSLF